MISKRPLKRKTQSTKTVKKQSIITKISEQMKTIPSKRPSFAQVAEAHEPRIRSIIKSSFADTQELKQEGLEMDDLVNMVILRLKKKYDSYNAKLGFSFSTHVGDLKRFIMRTYYDWWRERHGRMKNKKFKDLREAILFPISIERDQVKGMEGRSIYLREFLQDYRKVDEETLDREYGKWLYKKFKNQASKMNPRSLIFFSLRYGFGNSFGALRAIKKLENTKDVKVEEIITHLKYGDMLVHKKIGLLFGRTEALVSQRITDLRKAFKHSIS